MPDYVYPASDVAINSWTTDAGATSSLYESIDEPDATGTTVTFLTTNQTGAFGDASSFLISAMSFLWGGGAISSIIVPIKKFVTPTDNVTFALQADASGVPSGTSLATGSLAGSSLTTTLTQKTFPVDVVCASGTYWIVLSRTGAADATNYYGWAADTTASYTNGQAKYSDVGVSWTDSANDRDFIIVAGDSDYVQSPVSATSSQYYEASLQTHSDPAASTGHIAHYRYQKNVSGGQMDLTVGLYEGTTLRKSWAHTNISNAWTTQDQTLSGAEADSITDYTNLRLRFTPNTVTTDAVSPSFVAERASANSNSTVTTVDLVLTDLTIGNYLIIRAAADNSGTSGAARTFVVSNQSGSAIGTHSEYQQNNDPGVASAGVTCNVCVAKITATSGTVRLTYGGAVVQACVADEWTGIDPSTPVVGIPVKANGTASTNLVAGTALTDASVANGNVVLGIAAVEGPSSDTYTQDADTTNGSWSNFNTAKLGTSNGTADTNMTIYGAKKLVSATGAQTYNPTISVARDSAGIIIELAAAPAAIRALVSWANFELPVAGNATASVSVVTATAAILAPTIKTDETTAPATVTAGATAPAPTIKLSTTPTPAVVVSTAAIGAPVVQAGETVTPTTVATTASVVAPVLQAGETTTPATVVATAGVGSPAVVILVTATPAAVSAVAGVGVPTLSTAEIVSAVAVISIAGVGTPVVKTGETVSGTTVVATAAVGTPVIQTGSKATPGVVTAIAAVGATSLSTGEKASPTTVVATASVGAPTVSTSNNATPIPSTVVTTALVGSPTVIAGADITITPTRVVAIALVPTPTVQTVVHATSNPAVVAGSAGVGSPTVVISNDITVTPIAVVAIAGIGVAVLSTGVLVLPATTAVAAFVGAPIIEVPVVAFPATVAIISALASMMVSTGSTAFPHTVQIGGGRRGVFVFDD